MDIVKPPIQHMQYMYRDQVYADIWFNYFLTFIKVTTYSDDWLHLPFGRKPDAEVTLADLDFMLEERCFERGRSDAKQLLKSMDIPCYDPLAIVRVTNGFLIGDWEWIRFDNDPKDISLEALQQKWLNDVNSKKI